MDFQLVLPYLLLGLLGVNPAGPGTLSPNSPANDAVRLLTERDGSALRLQGAFTGQPDVSGELRYQLTVEKEGASGRSTSRQGGTFAAPAPDATATLSRVQLGVAAGDRIEATLTVHQASQLVGEARLDTLLQQ